MDQDYSSLRRRFRFLVRLITQRHLLEVPYLPLTSKPALHTTKVQIPNRYDNTLHHYMYSHSMAQFTQIFTQQLVASCAKPKSRYPVFSHVYAPRVTDIEHRIKELGCVLCVATALVKTFAEYVCMYVGVVVSLVSNGVGR